MEKIRIWADVWPYKKAEKIKLVLNFRSRKMCWFKQRLFKMVSRDLTCSLKLFFLPLQEVRVPLGRKPTTVTLEEAVTIATVATTAVIATEAAVTPRTRMR